MAGENPKAAGVKLPATTTYRVSIAGAMYTEPATYMGFDGEESLIMVSKLAMFGDEIELTDREAHRLKELGAVRAKGEPLTYEEMNDRQLDSELKSRGVKAVSSGADADLPLRLDKVNTLRTYDQGRAIVAPGVPAVLASEEIAKTSRGRA